MTEPSPGVVVSVESGPVRRLLGPTAWVVLEHLAVEATVSVDGEMEVVATARSVAGAVSVGKDTAARALRRLSAAGIVERAPQPRGSGGRFGGGSYQLRLPAGMTRVEGPVRDRSRVTEPARSRISSSKSPSNQLELVPSTKEPHS